MIYLWMFYVIFFHNFLSSWYFAFLFWFLLWCLHVFWTAKVGWVCMWRGSGSSWGREIYEKTTFIKKQDTILVKYLMLLKLWHIEIIFCLLSYKCDLRHEILCIWTLSYMIYWNHFNSNFIKYNEFKDETKEILKNASIQQSALSTVSVPHTFHLTGIRLFRSSSQKLLFPISF